MIGAVTLPAFADESNGFRHIASIVYALEHVPDRVLKSHAALSQAAKMANPPPSMHILIGFTSLSQGNKLMQLAFDAATERNATRGYLNKIDDFVQALSARFDGKHDVTFHCSAEAMDEVCTAMGAVTPDIARRLI